MKTLSEIESVVLQLTEDERRRLLSSIAESLDELPSSPKETRFSDRARRAMGLANHEAIDRQNEYVGTEHLLLGLIKDADGMGAKILRSYFPDFIALRADVQALTVRGDSPVNHGKKTLTPRLRDVVLNAINETRAMKHGTVGTQHLLLGILSDPKTVASQFLIAHGMTLESVRAQISRELAGNTSD